jgi:hypothetical protein
VIVFGQAPVERAGEEAGAEELLAEAIVEVLGDAALLALADEEELALEPLALGACAEGNEAVGDVSGEVLEEARFLGLEGDPLV